MLPPASTMGKPKKPLFQSPKAARRKVFARIKASTVAIVHAPDDLQVSMRQAKDPSGFFAPVTVLGSGFVVSDQGYIVTAKHVIQPWITALEAAQAAGKGALPLPSIPKFLWHGGVKQQQQQPGTIGWNFLLGGIHGFLAAKHLDLAVLIPASSTPTQPRPPLPPPLPMAVGSCQEGDEVAACGFPWGKDLHKDWMMGAWIAASFSQGIVSAVLPSHDAPVQFRTAFQFDAMISGGNSGGPVFDVGNGDVLGIVVTATAAETEITDYAPVPGSNPPQLTARTRKLKIPTGLARAIPIEHVAPLIAEVRRQAKAGAQAPGPPAAPAPSDRTPPHPPQS